MKDRNKALRSLIGKTIVDIDTSHCNQLTFTDEDGQQVVVEATTMSLPSGCLPLFFSWKDKETRDAALEDE